MAVGEAEGGVEVKLLKIIKTKQTFGRFSSHFDMKKLNNFFEEEIRSFLFLFFVEKIQNKSKKEKK